MGDASASTRISRGVTHLVDVTSRTTLTRTGSVTFAQYAGLIVHEIVHVLLAGVCDVEHAQSKQVEELICYEVQSSVEQILRRHSYTHNDGVPLTSHVQMDIKESNDMGQDIEYEYEGNRANDSGARSEQTSNLTRATFVFAASLLAAAFRAGTVAASPANAYEDTDRLLLEQCDALFATCQNAVVAHVSVAGPKSKATYDDLSHARAFIRQQLNTSRGR